MAVAEFFTHDVGSKLEEPTRAGFKFAYVGNTVPWFCNRSEHLHCVFNTLIVLKLCMCIRLIVLPFSGVTW